MSKSQDKRINIQKGRDMWAISDERLDELAGGSQNVAYFEIVSIAKELQPLRKIDIAYTLKYAEEAGAVCEEMKYHIRKVREEIKGETNSIPRWRVIDIVEEHLTQYLDLEEHDS